VVAANLAGGGESEVALPSLAHARYGAAGYGALLACFAAGGVIGTLSAARSGGLRRPAVLAGAVFLIESAAIALTPFLGEAGAAAMLFVSGATNGLGNVVVLAALQKWAPPALLGRVMSAIMLCALGSFPLSVAVSGVLVGHIGAPLFFPVAGAVVAVAILAGLTRREFREFGTGRGSGVRYGGSRDKAAAGLGSSGLTQISGPLGVAVVLSAHQPPVGAAWYCRRHRQRPAELVEHPVGLAVVADRAGGDAVLPDVLAAPAPGDHVVDGLRAAAAVGAPVVVPAHQRGPGQRHPVAVGHPDVPAQPDHRRGDEREGGGVQHRSGGVVVHDLGLAAQHQADGSPQPHGRQRFERHVEQQHASHRTSRWRRLS
jgi:hypothetical protein